MNSRESPARAEGTTGSRRPSVRARASLILLEDVDCGQVWRGVGTARRHFPRHVSQDTLQSLYENAMSAVLVQGATGEWFHTSVGVRQGCLLSPILFNIFLDDIMTHALDNYNGTISMGGGGRQITNLRFADDIDGITGEENELTKLVHNLDTAAAKFGMEISAEKTKIMTNNGTLQRDIRLQEP